MKALRWHGRGDVRLEDVEDAPAPAPNEVQIDVEWCGICGTDVEEYTNGPLVIPITPHPLTGLKAPMIIGHEVAGRVRRTGSNSGHLKPGQLVGIDGSFFCGICAACLRHQFNVCERWAFIGMSYPGGLAERMTVPSYMAIPVSEEIPAEWIALAEPFSVATRATRRGRLATGEKVVVLGGGTIGLAILQVARVVGARRVILVDTIPFRREKAVELGADAAIDASADIVEALRDICDGGPDVIFDCTGSNRTPGLAVRTVRLGGRVVQVGLPTSPGELDYLQLALREVELIGTVGHVYDEDYRLAVDLIASRKVDAQRLITHRLSLADAVTRGLVFLAQKNYADTLKIVITPKNS
jgi:(R,R)-butanediol dehydrogenase / meso-butanediol dehydrogenase / diacetyl reductase